MKRRTWLLRFILIILTLTVGVLSLPKKVEASSPYKTYTVDRYSNYIETQDAYEPYSMVKIIYNNLTLNDAQDMMTDAYDNLFIADSGNKRGLILDSGFNVITSFGENENLTYPRGIYVISGEQASTEYIYLTDYDSKNQIGRIIRYLYDLTLKTVKLDKIYGTPSSWMLTVDNYVYKPIKIAVSSNYYMYVTCEGSTSGVLMITPDNEFITYFASNSVSYTFIEKVEYFLYGDNEKANLTKLVASAPYNVMLDGSGYVYTITQGETSDGLSDNFKKLTPVVSIISRMKCLVQPILWIPIMANTPIRMP